MRAMGIVYSRCQLTVRKRACTARSELNVRFKVKLSALAQARIGANSLVNASAAVYEDRSVTVFRKHQRAKHSRRTRTDYERRGTELFFTRRRKLFRIGKPYDAEAQKLVFSASRKHLLGETGIAVGKCRVRRVVEQKTIE